MIRWFTCVCLIGALVVVGGCGSKSDETKPASADAQSKADQPRAQPTTGGVADAAKALQDMSQAMQNAAAAGNAALLGLDQLEAAMPELAGWTRGEVTSRKMAAPVAVAEAKAEYRKDEAELDLTIVDSALNQVVLMPLTMALAAGIEERKPNGYEKTVTVAGVPGLEKWDGTSGEAELSLVLGKRFMATIHGRGVKSAQPLRDLAAAIDVGKLATK